MDVRIRSDRTTLIGGGLLAVAAVVQLVAAIEIATGWLGGVDVAAPRLLGQVLAVVATVVLALGLPRELGIVGRRPVAAVALIVFAAGDLLLEALPPQPITLIEGSPFNQGYLGFAAAAAVAAAGFLGAVAVLRAGVLRGVAPWALLALATVHALVLAVASVPTLEAQLLLLAASSVLVLVGPVLLLVIGVAAAVHGRSAAIRTRLAAIEQHW